MDCSLSVNLSSQRGQTLPTVTPANHCCTFTYVMSSVFREEGQESEEGPVNPPPPARERDRSHSKTKKARRERRHADQGAETTASDTPPTSVLQAEAEPQTQVKTGINNRSPDRKLQVVRQSVVRFLRSCSGLFRSLWSSSGLGRFVRSSSFLFRS